MKKPRHLPDTVTIGGKQVPLLRAALIAQEADRRKVLPREVREVAIPSPAPSHVNVCRCHLSVGAAAALAAAADAQGLQIEKVIRVIVEDYAAPHEPMRARTRDTRRRVEGVWVFRVRDE